MNFRNLVVRNLDFNFFKLKKIKIFISNYQISKNHNLTSLKKLKSLFLTTKFLKFLTYQAKKIKILISNYQISKNHNLSSLKKLKSLFLTTKFQKFLTYQAKKKTQLEKFQVKIHLKF